MCVFRPDRTTSSLFPFFQQFEQFDGISFVAAIENQNRWYFPIAATAPAASSTTNFRPKPLHRGCQGLRGVSSVQIKFHDVFANSVVGIVCIESFRPQELLAPPGPGRPGQRIERRRGVGFDFRTNDSVNRPLVDLGATGRHGLAQGYGQCGISVLMTARKTQRKSLAIIASFVLQLQRLFEICSAGVRQAYYSTLTFYTSAIFHHFYNALGVAV
mmetsp:Transcript_25627/g.56185  ORF Transcript_25627/g.56185 Transcript_25627/m.56185 type:complete len:215 (-) Transcript_25627:1194-1838(-)